ncbi:hypothetical protein [Rhodanobacter sp. DHG33]|uniref:hypothetical protein n=1 Tax=Rhodanobacter sp. DHG33 TaxID=2775921 RepID=UPI00177E22BA|nr:hypothetical protein [Rhodanobacter sp. DHG33]MBD8900441.1 hypothetical protein [Rhodanobacter sp. DHG33]
MTQFHIYSGEQLIGQSELEFGDPPMGVAFGKFTPTPAYANIQSQVISLTGKNQASLHLSACLHSGEALEAVGGVCIADYSAEFGEDGLEVSVLGISSPVYEHLFPHHVAAYERQFPAPG